MPVATAGGPVLVHFFDFAQLNSVRTLPYVSEWARRYEPHGLTTIGVQAPRFPFGAERGRGRRGTRAARSRVPGRDRRRPPPLARLRLRGLAQPLPLEARRRARLVPLRRGRIPGDRGSDPGRAARAGRAAGAAGADGAPAANRRARREGDAPHPRALPRRLLGGALDRHRAGGPLRSRRRLRDGRGQGRDRRSTIDGNPATQIEIDGPGLYKLTEHPRHEQHTISLHPSAGLESGRSASPRACRRRAGALLNGRILKSSQSTLDRAHSSGQSGSSPPPSLRLGHCLANLLRQHEPHVLVDGAQLGDVLGAALAKELDQALDQLLGGARP